MSVAHSLTAAGRSKYSFAHDSDQALLRDVVGCFGQENAKKAEGLGRLAEIETRELYLPAGYPSMLAYCMGELGMSRDKALKRMKAARAAEEFPAIYDAVAEGRLELSVVVVLKPHLNEQNVEELLAKAAGHSKSEIEQILSQRAPLFEATPRSVAVDTALDTEPVSPGPLVSDEVAPGPPISEPVTVATSAGVARIAPPEIMFHFSVDPETYELYQRARDLISHKIPAPSAAKMFRLAFELFVRHHEKRKYGASDRPRAGKKSASPTTRYIPAHIRNAVRKRDQGRCTFVSKSGHRCESRRFLELDHIVEFARGGEATFENLRLRCRAHNQFTAKQTFGTEFMTEKREASKREAAETRKARETAAAQARAQAEAEAEAISARELDVIPWLRSLGFKADEAKEAAKLCGDMPDAPLEERVKRALSFFRMRGTVRVPASP